MQRIAVIGKVDEMGMGMEMNALPVFVLSNAPINKAQAAKISSKAIEEGYQNLYTPLTIIRLSIIRPVL